jgi:hypothetical protein
MLRWGCGQLGMPGWGQLGMGGWGQLGMVGWGIAGHTWSHPERTQPPTYLPTYLSAADKRHVLGHEYTWQEFLRVAENHGTFVDDDVLRDVWDMARQTPD